MNPLGQGHKPLIPNQVGGALLGPDGEKAGGGAPNRTVRFLLLPPTIHPITIYGAPTRCSPLHREPAGEPLEGRTEVVTIVCSQDRPRWGMWNVP